ncbi:MULTISPECIES: dioxygenase [unclassified Helicobacter]|uniref:dioxygenase family protein n=1 Tax=unclassified Helicobacter TaxID=2593540 RepID=UPI0011C0543A|nr:MULTISPECIES: class III extradiol ring-cleavage dioxygenase [unclassified Helicobacter]
MTSATFSPLQNTSKPMPVLFIGHGSPMNAITQGVFSENLNALGERITQEYGKPKALLVISAHWITREFAMRAQDGAIPMIYDMYGFPQELYEVRYNAQGAQNLAMEIKEKLGEKVHIDNSWGLDHGAWSVLLHLYPKAEIPIIMASAPVGLSINEAFAIGRALAFLRAQGVCIIASGNVVHNLGDFSNAPKDYALRFDAFIKEAILHDCADSNAESNRESSAADSKDLSSAMQAILQSPKMADFKRAVPTLEHFYPLILALGAWHGSKNPNHARKVEVFNEEIALGSVSMTSYFLH